MINQQPDIAIVILAAGESKRMGQPKQLLPWKQTTLLGHCIDQAKQSEIDDIYVVLGANYDDIYRVHKQSNITFLYNPDWRENLGNTIAFAITHIYEKKYTGVLLLLADQPQVNSDYINALYSKFKLTTPNHIIATTYSDENYGIPILFGKTFFQNLIENTYSNGAKPLLKQFKAYVVPIYPPIPIKDLDTKEEYQDLYHLFHKLP